MSNEKLLVQKHHPAQSRPTPRAADASPVGSAPLTHPLGGWHHAIHLSGSISNTEEMLILWDQIQSTLLFGFFSN